VKLDHIVLLVRDLEKSLPFYCALLPLIGFARTGEAVFGNADGLFIDLRQAKPDGADYERWGVGLNHLGFTAASRAAVDNVRDTMIAKGFEVQAVQILNGEDYALFLPDPDGIRIEVTAYS
jgi:catechol 2,3-dioxygenase-like lactoylglutathione lyase family enzyme